MTDRDRTDGEILEELHRDVRRAKSRCDTWARTHAPSDDSSHPLNRYLAGADGFTAAAMKYADMLENRIKQLEDAKIKLPDWFDGDVRSIVG